MAGKRAKNWTAEEVAEHYQRQGKTLPADVRQVLTSLGLENRIRLPTAATPAVGEDGQPKAKPKRKGVDVRPIKNSLKAPLIYAASTPQPTLSLWFDGARMLTVNELFSVQQYRKEEVFSYKKAWQKLIARGLLALPPGQPKPRFEGPTRLWLYRCGQKKVDLDSLPTMFKYAIDALRREGVIPDDNPEIIVEPRLIQEICLPAVGLRLERLWDWHAPELANLMQHWLGLEAPAPLDRIP